MEHIDFDAMQERELDRAAAETLGMEIVEKPDDVAVPFRVKDESGNVFRFMPTLGGSDEAEDLIKNYGIKVVQKNKDDYAASIREDGLMFVGRGANKETAAVRAFLNLRHLQYEK